MVISLGKVFEPFIEQRPICVMARGGLENLFNADKIDALFARTAAGQYTRALLCSSVVDLRGQVVLGVQPSVQAAYQAQAAQLSGEDPLGAALPRCGCFVVTLSLPEGDGASFKEGQRW